MPDTAATRIMNAASPLPMVLIVLLSHLCLSVPAFSQTRPPPRFSPRVFASFGSGASPASDSDSDPVARLPLLEAELATLAYGASPDDAGDVDVDVIQQRRKELEGAVSDTRTAAEFGVRAAQHSFYEAFAEGDYDAMDRVWSREAYVRCVHPGMPAIEGRGEVMDSWRLLIAAAPRATKRSGTQSGSAGSARDDDEDDEGDDDEENFDVRPERSRIEVSGQMAICSCVEVTLGGMKLEALNVYRRENEAWKMTLHMVSPITWDI